MTVPTFGGYTTGANAISANAQTDVLAQIDKFAALIGDPSDRPSAPGVGPIFQMIPPPVAEALHNEIAALKAAIDATATS